MTTIMASATNMTPQPMPKPRANHSKGIGPPMLKLHPVRPIRKYNHTRFQDWGIEETGKLSADIFRRTEVVTVAAPAFDQRSLTGQASSRNLARAFAGVASDNRGPGGIQCQHLDLAKAVAGRADRGCRCPAQGDGRDTGLA